MNTNPERCKLTNQLSPSISTNLAIQQLSMATLPRSSRLMKPQPVFRMWIRIQIGQRIRIQAGQNWPKKRKNEEISCLKSFLLDCRLLLEFEFLRGHKLYFNVDKKKFFFFKNLGLDTDPDSRIRKTDPYWPQIKTQIKARYPVPLSIFIVFPSTLPLIGSRQVPEGRLEHRAGGGRFLRWGGGGGARIVVVWDHRTRHHILLLQEIIFYIPYTTENWQ